MPLAFEITDNGPHLPLGIAVPAICQTRTSRIGTWKALIGTGATMSVVSARVCEFLDLPNSGSNC